jgi:hypothetical protein
MNITTQNYNKSMLDWIEDNIGPQFDNHFDSIHGTEWSIRSRFLFPAAGYSSAACLETTIWFNNDSDAVAFKIKFGL